MNAQHRSHIRYLSMMYLHTLRKGSAFLRSLRGSEEQLLRSRNPVPSLPEPAHAAGGGLQLEGGEARQRRTVVTSRAVVLSIEGVVTCTPTHAYVVCVCS